MKRQIEPPVTAPRVFSSVAAKVDGVSSLESDLAMLGFLLDQTLRSPGLGRVPRHGGERSPGR